MIVVFGTYDADRHPRVRVLIEGLRAHGQEVVELNRPLGFTTAERVAMLQRPVLLPRMAVRLVARWWALAHGARRLRSRGAAPGTVLVGYMGHFDVLLAKVLFPRAVIVLDHLIFAGDTAADRGAAGLRVRVLRWLDAVSTSAADVVVTDTAEHREMLRDQDRGVVVAVGAPERWFYREPPETTAGSPLRIVFFGLFTPLQGALVAAEAIARLVASGAAVEVTMIGTGQDHDGARRLLDGVSQVTWLDWVEPAEIADVVAAHDVCLGIFSDTPKGRRVVPNKVFQGIAAGCVVVTSDTAPQRRAVGPWVELVPPADPAALADRLAALCEPAALASARARARAGQEAVTPSTVVQPLVEALAARPVTR